MSHITYRRKVRSNRGETIVEVLVALLISSIGMIMLANMIVTSTNLITRSKEVITEYEAKQVDNGVVDHHADASVGTGKAVMNVIETAAGAGTPVNTPVKINDGDAAKEVTVKYYENSTIGTHKVISYKVG